MVNLTATIGKRLAEEMGCSPTTLWRVTFDGDYLDFAHQTGKGILSVELTSNERIDIRWPAEVFLLRAWLQSKCGFNEWEKEKSITIKATEKGYSTEIGEIQFDFANAKEVFAYLKKFVV